MARKKTLLEKMRANPKQDWTIQNVETLCNQNGLTISKPASGSHYIVHSKSVDGLLSVPARRPIKPVYIRQLVSLCDDHKRYSQTVEGGE